MSREDDNYELVAPERQRESGYWAHQMRVTCASPFACDLSCDSVAQIRVV